MAQSHSDTEGEFPLKLLVDEKQKKVMFAEAGKELVDYFFSLMLLPWGTVVSLVGTESVPGSMGKLYQSVVNLDASYMSGVPTTSSDNIKAELISPRLHCSGLSQGALRLLWKNTGCTSTGDVKKAIDEGRDKGFVRELVTYTITDDLSISPLSTISCLALIKGLRGNDLGALQERTVMVGVKQIPSNILSHEEPYVCDNCCPSGRVPYVATTCEESCSSCSAGRRRKQVFLVGAGGRSHGSSCKYYRCGRSSCTYVTTISGTTCPSCSGPMSSLLQSSNSSSKQSVTDQPWEEGLVKGLVTYTITDDLSVTPLSSISSISHMQKLVPHLQNLASLEERTVM